MIIIWILLAIVVVLGLYVMLTYNGLVSLRNRIENAWAQIDVQLKRRYDLIPNLVETVKGYAVARAGDPRGRHPGPQRGHDRQRPRRPGPGREHDHRRPEVACSPCPRPTPTSRPTRTS